MPCGSVIQYLSERIIATGRLFLGQDRLLHGLQPLFDVLQFPIVFGLHTKVIEPELCAAVGNSEIDTRIVQHPFYIIVMPYRGLAAEQGVVKLDILLEVLYCQVYMESFHANPLKLIYE